MTSFHLAKIYKISLAARTVLSTSVCVRQKRLVESKDAWMRWRLYQCNTLSGLSSNAVYTPNSHGRLRHQNKNVTTHRPRWIGGIILPFVTETSETWYRRSRDGRLGASKILLSLVSTRVQLNCDIWCGRIHPVFLLCFFFFLDSSAGSEFFVTGDVESWCTRLRTWLETCLRDQKESLSSPRAYDARSQVVSRCRNYREGNEMGQQTYFIIGLLRECHLRIKKSRRGNVLPSTRRRSRRSLSHFRVPEGNLS